MFSYNTLGYEPSTLITIPSDNSTTNATSLPLPSVHQLHRLSPSIYFRPSATTGSQMCFMVHWHRVCRECGEEDIFSQDVVHCPTITDAGLANGMMDCVAKNQIMYANAAPYVCEECCGQSSSSEDS
jgi:hypothetical protein